MGAGLSDFWSYGDTKQSVEVQTLSLEDAWERLGAVPKYIKADIEGAELTLVKRSIEFLKTHLIHLVFESNHVVDGQLTAGPLDAMLNGVGYRAWSSDEFGQLFSWAKPPAELETIGA